MQKRLFVSWKFIAVVAGKRLGSFGNKQNDARVGVRCAARKSHRVTGLEWKRKWSGGLLVKILDTGMIKDTDLKVVANARRKPEIHDAILRGKWRSM